MKFFIPGMMGFHGHLCHGSDQKQKKLWGLSSFLCIWVVITICHVQIQSVIVILFSLMTCNSVPNNKDFPDPNYGTDK